MRAHEASREAGHGSPPRSAQPARRTPHPSPGVRGPAAALALQRTVGNAAVARMIEEERRGSGGDPAPVRQDAEPVQRSSVHQVLRSAGRPLDGATRHEMESRLGADFSDVRLHTGSTARASAAEVGARAYTSGNHVVIGEGGADRHTLAHELTHVIQQRQGPVAGTDNGAGLRVSDPSDHYEREAEANATRALATPLAADRAGAFGDGVPPPEAGTQVQRTGARRTGAQRTAVQRMPPSATRTPRRSGGTARRAATPAPSPARRTSISTGPPWSSSPAMTARRNSGCTPTRASGSLRWPS